MDRTNHAAVQWNPPRKARRTDAPFDGKYTVESANECTGLMTHVPGDEGAAKAISELYDIHRIEPADR